MAKYKLPKIEELFDAGVHFGHQVRRWNPNMEPYIFTQRSGIHIIDLDETHKGLKEAAVAMYDIATTGGQIIFVGTKRQAKEIVKTEAKKAGALYVIDRWLGGTITNYRIIRKNMDKLVDYLKKREEGEFDKYTKKERLLLDRAIDKLERSVGGIVSLQGNPAGVFVVDARREKTAIKEANIAGIPVAALVDTNSDPRPVDYPIPGNDDAIRSIAFIVKVIADAVEAGYAEYAHTSVKEAEERAKEAEKAKEAEVVKVSTTEASHATENAGKAHVKKVKSGEEEVKVKKVKEEAPKKKPGRPKKEKAKEEPKKKKRGRPKKEDKK